jgi:hypothetical protein
MQVTKAPFFSDYSLPMNNLQLMHGRIDHLKNNTFLDQENIFLFKDFFPWQNQSRQQTVHVLMNKARIYEQLDTKIKEKKALDDM